MLFLIIPTGQIAFAVKHPSPNPYYIPAKDDGIRTLPRPPSLKEIWEWMDARAVKREAARIAEEAAKEKAVRLAASKASGFMGKIARFFGRGNPLGLLQVSPVQYVDSRLRDEARNLIVVGGNIDRIRLLSEQRKTGGLSQEERTEYEQLREMLINAGYTSVKEAIKARNEELRSRGFKISE